VQAPVSGLEQGHLASFFSVFFCGFEQMCRRLDRFKPTHIDPNQFVHLSAPLARPTTACGVPLRFRQSRFGDIREAHH
jgi:hypothetical protein